MSPTVTGVFVALLVIGLFLAAAKWLRVHVALFRRLFLPASVIGGASRCWSVRRVSAGSSR